MARARIDRDCIRSWSFHRVVELAGLNGQRLADTFKARRNDPAFWSEFSGRCRRIQPSSEKVVLT